MRTESRELLAVGIFAGRCYGFESRLGERIELLLHRGRKFSPRTSANSVAASTIVLAALMVAGSLAPRGRFTATNVSLKMLVMRAWKVKNFEIFGGPGWIDFDRYERTLRRPRPLFTDIQEQLGLRLEARRENTEILVVDHVEKPDAN